MFLPISSYKEACTNSVVKSKFELCLLANESSFEALHNSHQFFYASMINIYWKCPKENSGISIKKMYDFYLIDQDESFYSFSCQI